jgi:hypothetical protein
MKLTQPPFYLMPLPLWPGSIDCIYYSGFLSKGRIKGLSTDVNFGGVFIQSMISIMGTIMSIEELSNIEALQNSLKGDQVTALFKIDEGVARRLLLKLTGYSNPQSRRLIGKYK